MRFIWDATETTSFYGGQPPAGLRTPCRNTPVAKRSGWVSARCTYGEAVRFPDEPSEEPCEARSQEGARELRSVSTDRRSLPKAVARVVPQGPVPAKRKVVLVVFNLKTHG